MTARDRLRAKARRHGWSVREYSSAMTLRKDGVTVAVRFKMSRNGEGVMAASWQHKAITGRNMLEAVLKSLES